MTKQNLKRAMSQHCENAEFITVKELTTFLGVKNEGRVKKEFLTGLDRVGKRYLINDVADRILEKRKND